jgi:hypothetical protein
MIQPRLADWAMVVVPDGRPGVLMVVGGDDAGFHDVVSRMSVEDLGLGRLLRTGRTELVHRHGRQCRRGGPGHDDSPFEAVAEAATLCPAELLGAGLTARGRRQRAAADPRAGQGLR